MSATNDLLFGKCSENEYVRYCKQKKILRKLFEFRSLGGSIRNGVTALQKNGDSFPFSSAYNRVVYFVLQLESV